MTIEEHIGAQIAHFRARVGWGQSDLGRAMGWSRQAVWACEHGHRAFPIAELVKLAGIIGCSVPDLLPEPEASDVWKERALKAESRLADIKKLVNVE